MRVYNIISRVCTTYLKDLNSLTLPTNSCSSIFTMDTKEARDAVNHINTETNAWIQITTISATIPSILVDCFMGGWSDLFGRSAINSNKVQLLNRNHI